MWSSMEAVHFYRGELPPCATSPHPRSGSRVIAWPTAGVFGSAVAVGKLLKLNETQMAWALGLAGTQSCGLRENLNTMGKFLHTGNAARGGMTAAFLAQRGFTASDKILEAPRGFAHVLSQERK
jgi:2-methylcitrate dehydratase PrpD